MKTHSPLFLLAGFATNILLLTVACGDSGSTDSPASTSAAGGSSSTGEGGGAGGNPIAGGTGGSGGAGGEGPIGDLYVDSALGLDTNVGSFDEPYKTIGAALAAWQIGQDIIVMPGTYSPASGEAWNYELPDGVLVRANGVGALLLGNPNQTAFVSSGTAQIEYLQFDGFDTSLQASAGLLELRGVTFDAIRLALDLSGTANVQVLDYSSASEVGAVANLRDSAVLTVDTMSISDSYSNSSFAAAGNSALVLSGVDAANVSGALASVVEAASIEMSNVTAIDSGDSHLFVFDTTGSVTAESVFASGAPSYGIRVNRGVVALSDVNVSGCGAFGLLITNGSVTFNGGSVSNCVYGGIQANAGQLTVIGAMLTSQSVPMSGASGIEAFGAEVTVRNTTISHQFSGVYSSQSPRPNLGTAAQPGGNTFMSNSVSFRGTGAAGTAQAHGNTWTANVQGADAAGLYSPQIIVGPVDGANMTLATGVAVQL